MNPLPSGACAQCGKVTTKRCVGCNNGPDYVAGDASDIFYCSKPCQAQHRTAHGSYCIRMITRKEVVRAGRILKSAFLTYKAVFYEHDILKIGLEKDVLTLHLPPLRLDGRRLKGSWGPFPGKIPCNITEREAALCFKQCNAAVALLGPLSRKLLSGTGWDITLMNGQLKNPVFRPRLSGGNPDPPVVWHAAIRARHSESQEEFIIDPTGAQYGISRPCMPFSQYQANYRGVWLPDRPYDQHERTDLNLILDKPSCTEIAHLQHKDPSPMFDLRVEMCARAHFADFISNRKGLNRTMLDNTDAGFEKEMNAFISDLRNHLNGFDW
ncbi:hypothetical protein B0T11DRAFT_351779 [Plectosphaerella cucumerina]|uniref:MYND-type domain-containing protein n=1 Tax=Plectosphaerella cucumerina TaxID=40658 RepID=A0A8K0TK74_9PEZI|nr:hypothetical protein B0T11DRAFT_351779 [Plectosphaerella cucumerina]